MAASDTSFSAVVGWLGWTGAELSLPPPSDSDTTLRDLICIVLVFFAVGETYSMCVRNGYFDWLWGPSPPPPLYFCRTTDSWCSKVEKLCDYDGKARSQIFIAIKGRVFDVSSGLDYYGPEGGGYQALAGQDASRALGIMSLQGKEFWEEDCRIRKIDDLTNKQFEVMKEWEDKYIEKYPVVGTLIRRSGTVGEINFVPAEGDEALRIAAKENNTIFDSLRSFVNDAREHTEESKRCGSDTSETITCSSSSSRNAKKKKEKIH